MSDSEPSTSYYEETKDKDDSKEEATAEEDEEGLEGYDGCETGDSDSSSGPPGAETCAICLGRIRGEVGSPEVCDHIFCLICILEWAKTNATCPQDRKSFVTVSVQECFDGPVTRTVSIKKEKEEEPSIPDENPTYCEVCHECNREERLLLCDGCDLGYHLECLDPPLSQVPVEEWFCPDCAVAQIPAAIGLQQSVATRDHTSRRSSGRSARNEGSQPRQGPRRIPRTQATERVRARILLQRTRARAAKRKRRKQNKRKRMEDGEIEDPRPPVKQLNRFSFFGFGEDDVDAEHTDDDYATQVLSGTSAQGISHRDQASRRAAAVRMLHYSSFNPLPGYSGKTPTNIMERLDAQQSDMKEDDILTSILEGQSIALSSSSKLSLTTDRKLSKEGEINGDVLKSIEKENLVMADPLPSQRSPDVNERERERDEKIDKKDYERRKRNEEDERRREKHSDSERRRDRSWDNKRRENSEEDFRRWRNRNDGRNYVGRGDASRYGRRGNYREENRYRFYHHQNYTDKHSSHESHSSWERFREHSIHQSPLEDRRRSSAQFNYQRSVGHQSFRYDRDRYQNSSPNKRRPYFYRDHRRDEHFTSSHYESDYSRNIFSRERSNSRDRNHSSKSDSNYRRLNNDSNRSESGARKPNVESQKDEDLQDKKLSSSSKEQEREYSRQHRPYGEMGHHSSHQGFIRRKSSSPDSVSSERISSKSQESHHKQTEKKEIEAYAHKIRKEKNLGYESKSKEETDTGSRAKTFHNTEKPHSKKNFHEYKDHRFSKDTGSERYVESERYDKTEYKITTPDNKQKDGKNLFSLSGSSQEVTLDSDKQIMQKIVSEKRQECTKEKYEDTLQAWNYTSDKSGNNKKKESGSNKKRLFNLFGDESESSKESKKMSVVYISDEEEDLALPNTLKWKVHNSKNGGKSSKNTFQSDDSSDQEEDTIPCLNLISQTKEKQKHVREKNEHSPPSRIKEKKININDKYSRDRKSLPELKISPTLNVPVDRSQADTFNKKDEVDQNHQTLFTDDVMETRRMQYTSQSMMHSKSFHKSKMEELLGVDLPITDQRSSKSKGIDIGLGSEKKELHMPNDCNIPFSKSIFQHTLDIIKNFKSSMKNKSISSESSTLAESYTATLIDSKAHTSESGSPQFKIYEKSGKETLIDNRWKSNKNGNTTNNNFNDTRDMESSMHEEKSNKKVDSKLKIIPHIKKYTEDVGKSCSTLRVSGKTIENVEKFELHALNIDKKISGEDVHLEKKRKLDCDPATEKMASHIAHTVAIKKADMKATEKNGNISKNGGRDCSGNPHNKQQGKSSLEVKVVNEVKYWLDPYYRDKNITREEYKEIVAKCVNKVVSAECGDIVESEKMHSLVDGYIKLYKHRRSKQQQKQQQQQQ